VVDIFRDIFLFSVILVVAKAMMGYHFPWEKCSCCGKKFRDHKKD